MIFLYQKLASNFLLQKLHHTITKILQIDLNASEGFQMICKSLQDVRRNQKYKAYVHAIELVIIGELAELEEFHCRIV